MVAESASFKQPKEVIIYLFIYIFIRQTAATTNKSESKTNATDSWIASLTNKEPLDNSWS